MMTIQPKRFDEDWILPILTGCLAAAVVIVVVWLTTGDAEAGVVVIYDTGTARPISDFIAIPTLAVPQDLPAINEQLGDEFLTQLFPVHTPELTPGEVTASAVNLTLPQPFFILGTDALSKHWLYQYRDRLIQISAVGLVVEASSLEDFQVLKATAPALPLSPVRASELAKQLSLNHYPVLITASRIEQ
jgi:integrating conjugative element protein (TIGR03765 family)